MRKLIHQHDINGCGIATMANLLNIDYQTIKKEFEDGFYPITKGVKVSDIVKFLKIKGLNYKVNHI
jgi:predicted double-glycine peptidase